MFKTLWTRLKQGHHTSRFPKEAPKLSQRFRGLPMIDSSKCPQGCQDCAQSCPTDAITLKDSKIKLDLGRCLFCTDCVEACPEQSISYSQDYRLATTSRVNLILEEGRILKLAQAADQKIKKTFGRSLKLRQVSAGGCNGCEVETNVLNTLVFDLGRFGIQFVASPRHADGLLITGPVTENMKLALKKTYDAVPSPKIVIAVGACAISGGPYIHHPQVHNGADSTVPVDLYIPGCPPHPFTILDGLLRFLDNLK